MATLAGTDLGIVKREGHTRNSGLFNMPMPLGDSDDALLADLMGTTRTITIDGEFTGNQTAQDAFIDAIEGIQNGNQSSSSFVSDRKGTFDVIISDFSYTFEEGAITKVNYTLTLIEGTVI